MGVCGGAGLRLAVNCALRISMEGRKEGRKEGKKKQGWLDLNLN